MNRILVVEDDKKLNEIVCKHLRKNGFDVHGVLSVNDAYNQMYRHPYELLISDIMMPGIDGYELAESVRRMNPAMPILFMSARDDFMSKQKGFSVGIDDYMVKPVNLEELTWRVKALLRRANIQEEKRLKVGKVLLDAAEMSISIDEQEIPITVREFNILYKLLSYPKQTFSREQLFDDFWGMDSDSSLRSVDVYINRIREKFSNCDDFQIKTVYGMGYKAVIQCIQH